MSLDTLASEMAARQTAAAGPAAVQFGGAPPPAPPQNALNQISKYLPTESITLYIAGIAVFPGSLKWGATLSHDDLRGLFFLIMWFLTPLFLYLATVMKVRAGTPPISWPTMDCEMIMKLAFSFIAFWLWAHALPDKERTDSEMIPIYAFLAIVASTLFSFFEGLCPGTKAKTAPAPNPAQQKPTK